MQDLIFDTEGQELGDIFFYNTLAEVVVTTIPITVRQYFQKKENRQKLFEEIGEKAFLMPKELKFPVVNPFTKDFDCRLIQAAIIRSKQHKYPEVEHEAKELYEKHGCKEELKIILKEGQEDGVEFTYDELFEIFDFDSVSIFESQDEYQKLFDDTLKRFKVESIIELSKDDKKKFFNILEKNWTKEEKEK